MFQAFEGTDAEFVQVTLPTPTPECLDNRVTPEERCAADQDIRVGAEVGSCAEPVITLQKLILRGLYDTDNPQAARSLAYQVLKYFSLTELQFGEIFNNWHSMSSPREAVCQWAVDNIGSLNASVPPLLRTIQESDVPTVAPSDTASDAPTDAQSGAAPRMHASTTSLAVFVSLLVVLWGW